MTCERLKNNEQSGGAVRFLVEMDGRTVELAALPGCEVLDTVSPIAERLHQLLASVSESVDVVFAIGGDGTLSVRLRGSVLAVNEARDLIGEQCAISPVVN